MYTCQCERFQVGESNGVPLKEVAQAVFQRFPSTEVSLRNNTKNTSPGRKRNSWSHMYMMLTSLVFRHC